MNFRIEEMFSSGGKIFNQENNILFFDRVFSRIAVIPFNRIPQKQNLGNSMKFSAELKAILNNAIQSSGTLLELCIAFKAMHEGPLFEDILTLNSEMSEMDMTAQLNYSLLLFSAGKVCNRNIHFCNLSIF